MKSAYGYCCYYWWWWWFALLGLLTALIVPQADSLHLTNKNVALYYGDNAVTSLASFRYSHNGQFKYQATSMHLADSNDEQNQNTTYQESVTLVITTEEIWLSFIQSIKTLHVDVCPDWPQHLKSTTYISFANLTKPHLPEYVLPIQSMGEYLVLIINCSNKKINLEFNLEMLNMGPNGKWTQFTYGLFQLPWVYLGFAGGVWPAICIIWWSLRYKNRKNDTLLNRLLMIIPHCRLIFATLLCLEAFYYSRHGEESYILLPFQAIFRFCSGMLIYTTNMLVSKGWCVTRRHMLKLELRTVLGKYCSIDYC
ncbi:hypothetical protein BDF19DRAFT_273166 [Syncephalis fuscata]|nr:hypothetical protein BDF19DRAFT_273166 [Syncephalis fuscata]